VTGHWIRNCLILILLLGAGGVSAGAEVNPWLERAHDALAALDTLSIPANPEIAVDVKQPLLGFLVDQLDHKYIGIITSEHLKTVIETHPEKSRFSHTIFSEIRRAPYPQPNKAYAQIVMPGPTRVSVPYSFLGYHPGTIECSESVVMEEWHLGTHQLKDAWKVDSNSYALTDVTVWAILEGSLLLDVDGWLDKLLGGKLDDTRLVGGVLFSYEGVRYALAMGYNKKGQGQYGALDLKADKAHVSSPPALRVIARNMRLKVIRRLSDCGVAPWWDELKR
jgi:hypothetical protein